MWEIVLALVTLARFLAWLAHKAVTAESELETTREAVTLPKIAELDNEASASS